MQRSKEEQKEYEDIYYELGNIFRTLDHRIIMHDFDPDKQLLRFFDSAEDHAEFCRGTEILFKLKWG